MYEHQLARNQFIDSNLGFKETKQPIPLWRKLIQEGIEAAQASITYLRSPTEANRYHLGEELADMVFIIIDMATHSHINLDQAMRDKLEKDRMRFPPGTVLRRSDYRRRKRQLGER